MFILAESGSSKTDWLVADNNTVLAKCQTRGLNPYFVDSNEIAKVFAENVLPLVDANEVKKIFFYGSGCASDSSKEIIFNGISKLITSEIFVEHDMMASARALFSEKSGIACILGTGSNTCLYDGKNIVDGINSLGYVLGDEGSGAVIGKKWLNAYFNHEMPDFLAEKFKICFDVQLEVVLENVYKKPSPNQYLASFSPFICENREEEFVQVFLEDIFSDFFRKMVFCYPNYQDYPLGFVGSIAFAYQDVIKSLAEKSNLFIEKIVKQPADELLMFHQKLL